MAAIMNSNALKSAGARVAAPSKRVQVSRCVKSVARRTAVKCVATPDAPSGTKIFNFSAGPAVLPKEVLATAQAEMMDWHGSGMSVMEMSHRGAEFKSIIEKAEADLRTLLEIPDNYKVLFVQGGASTQFAAIPLNLTKDSSATADHVLTGAWGKKAIKEAGKYCNAHTAATSAETNFDSIPAVDTWNLTEGAAYVHTCSNETIGGVEYKEDPTIATGVPLVTDMSSNFLSKPVDVSKYGVIYAGAQKNVGPSGVTILIVREDLIGNARPECPTMLDWATMANDGSLYNTPPSYGIYMCGLTFQHLLDQGGLAAVQAQNEAKASILYKAIETSGGFYSCPVDSKVRSLMNVPFRVVPNELEGEFLEEAKKAGLMQLKGHRSVGGIRASIYNAMPQEGVEALVELMLDFKAKHA